MTEQNIESKQSWKQGSFALVFTIVVIELISGFTQGFYVPLVPYIGELAKVDTGDQELFNIIPTAIAALAVPILTKLGDTRGYRKLLRIVIPLVFGATIVIALGIYLQSWTIILLGRVLNGPIAVWLPLHIALVHAKTEGQRTSKAVSLIVAVLTLGTVLGTGLSGVIYQLFGGVGTSVVANSLFLTTLIPIITGLIATVLVVFVMPEFISGAPLKIDVWGFVLLGLIMLLAIFGFVTIVDAETWYVGLILLALTAVVVYFWIKYELKQEVPAVDIRILFSKAIGPFYLANLLFGVVFYGFQTAFSNFLKSPDWGYGFDASIVSITFTGFLIINVVAALVIPPLLNKLGSKLLTITGNILSVIGFVLWFLAGTILGNTIFILVAIIFLIGFGLGIIGAVLPVVIPQRSPKEIRGLAVGLYNSSGVLGGALGSGLFLAILKIGQVTNSEGVGEATATGYNLVWIISAGILLLAAILTQILLVGDKKFNQENKILG